VNDITVTARTAAGETIKISRPMRFYLNCSIDSPADGLSLTASCGSPLPELAKIEVKSGGSRFFYGIVDEQTATLGAKGCVTAIEARSMAALLLDNEAIPAVYNRPSLSDIIAIHARPYGFGYSGGGVCPGEFTVAKGMSEWEVIDTFCRCVCKAAPRVTGDMTIELSPPGSEAVLISNQKGGVPFLNAKISIVRYAELSAVLYKPDEESGYRCGRVSEEAAKRGITRRRLVSLVGGPPYIKQYGLDAMLEKSAQKGFAISAVLPGLINGLAGRPAEFKDPRLGCHGGLVVSAVKYSLDPTGIKTTITMHKKEA